MIELDYSFDPDELKKLDQFDFRKLTLTDLDYYLFGGNIFFRIDGVSFDTPWGWIPVLNYCVRMCLVLLELQEQGESVLEFTENDAEISFTREADGVCVSADFLNAAASTCLSELRVAVKHFAGKLLRDLLHRWPSLAAMEPFQERLRTIRETCGGLSI